MRTANYHHKYPHGRSNRTVVAVGASYNGPPPGYATESEVVTFRVWPPAHREAMVVGEPPPLPEPLNIRQRTARLALDAADPEVLQAVIDSLGSASTQGWW